MQENIEYLQPYKVSVCAKVDKLTLPYYQVYVTICISFNEEYLHTPSYDRDSATGIVVWQYHHQYHSHDIDSGIIDTAHRSGQGWGDYRIGWLLWWVFSSLTSAISCLTLPCSKNEHKAGWISLNEWCYQVKRGGNCCPRAHGNST